MGYAPGEMAAGLEKVNDEKLDVAFKGKYIRTQVVDCAVARTSSPVTATSINCAFSRFLSVRFRKLCPCLSSPRPPNTRITISGSEK